LKDGRYHRDIRLPQVAIAPFLGTYRLRLSAHAEQAMTEDKYGRIEGVVNGTEITVDETAVVEVQVENGKPVKALVRLEYNERLDLVLALFPSRQGVCFVKTVWLNEATDLHKGQHRWGYNN
jgi:hypothetical protein